MTRNELLRWLERGTIRRRHRPGGLVRRRTGGGTVPQPLPIPPASKKLKVTQTVILPGDKGGPAPAPAPSAGTLIGRLEAPTVKMSATVLEGSDDGTLSRGAGHIEDTPFPGQPGNVGIAGHRDTVFRPLRNIKVGDPMQLTTSDRLYRYKISKTVIVGPDDVYVLDPTKEPTLTLVTCYPVRLRGHAPKRFIVQAQLVGNEPRTATTHSIATPTLPDKKGGQDCSWPPRHAAIKAALRFALLLCDDHGERAAVVAALVVVHTEEQPPRGRHAQRLALAADAERRAVVPHLGDQRANRALGSG
jgi:sortase A